MKLIQFIFCSVVLFFLSTVRARHCNLYSQPELDLSQTNQFSLPHNYESLSARRKLEIQQNLINKFKTPNRWEPEREPEVFGRVSQNVTMDTHTDQMPNEPDGKLREKLVHSVGLTAQAHYESVGNHHYTGLFKGSKHVIARFSPNTEQNINDFRPSFVLKCFRDGHPSGNIITMFGMLGQGSNSNPFWNDMTNHPPRPQILGPVLDSFAKSSDFVTMMGLSDFAERDQHGKKEKHVKFPFRIILHPTTEARYTIPNDLDMSSKFPFYIPVLQDMKFNHLYDVYAQDSPYSEDVKLIGRIKMRSAFQTSSYADKKLFFKHQRYEDDLKYRPEWEDFAHEQLEKFSKIDPVFFRPNLSYNH